MLTAERVIGLLGLEPLPHEGGAFREMYRSPLVIPAGSVEGHGAGGVRSCSTQIYYLLRRGETSALHRVRSDEVFHHYFGDPVEQLRIRVGSRTHGVGGAVEQAEVVTIGPDIESGQRPQVLVPAGVWQGARLGDGPAGYALMGCSVAPGFDWEDFELITAEGAGALAVALPAHAGLIRGLTPVPGRTRA